MVESAGEGVVVACTEFGEAGGDVSVAAGVAPGVCSGLGAGGGDCAAPGVVGIVGRFGLVGVGEDENGALGVGAVVVAGSGTGTHADQCPVGVADERGGGP